jgi:hypothetical protein
MTDKKMKKTVDTLADHYFDFIRNQCSLQIGPKLKNRNDYFDQFKRQLNFIRATDQNVSKKSTRYLNRTKQLEEENEALKSQLPNTEDDA